MKDKIALYGIIGLTASVLVGIGEYFLHYSPMVLSAAGNYDFFKYVPLSNLTTGHFLAVVGLLLYFPGYFHVYYMLKSGNRAMAKGVLFLGIAAFAVGGIWIGSRAFLGSIVHLEGEMPVATYQLILNSYTNHLEILVLGLRIIILLLSIVFSVTILKGKTFYKRWMAALNPLFILLILLLTMLIPSVGKHIVPILMNVTHFIFFSLSLYHYYLHLKSKRYETR